jgi:hypothetical protein
MRVHGHDEDWSPNRSAAQWERRGAFCVTVALSSSQAAAKCLANLRLAPEKLWESTLLFLFRCQLSTTIRVSIDPEKMCPSWIIVTMEFNPNKTGDFEVQKVHESQGLSFNT